MHILLFFLLHIHYSSDNPRQRVHLMYDSGTGMYEKTSLLNN